MRLRNWIVIFSLILCSTVSLAQQKLPTAKNIVAEAKTAATKNNKKIFIIFHASWCGWCHKLDTVMNDASCKNLFNSQFEIRHIDVMEHGEKAVLENPGGRELMAQYAAGQGIPFWIVLDKKGNLLADSRMPAADGKKVNVGCPSTPEEIDYFISVLQKTTSLLPRELTIIKDRFSLKKS
ncbi:thioredoxin family protein [Chitinophaga silvatica]|uniref:Thioredoxin family protein n=1 Tax=Chitinophaga silvatica TaxID=2282649 RepID=A0A3E1Y3C2_9BACT|nr:thioredoxin family protein [Chitinophaga silvatica]RFS19200.1 thioredoxin family protein [Chitinophaga silvatica]